MITSRNLLDLARRLGLMAEEYGDLAGHLEAILRLAFDPSAILSADPGGRVPALGRGRVELARDLLGLAQDWHGPVADVLTALAARVADPTLDRPTPPPLPSPAEVRMALAGDKIRAIKDYRARTTCGGRLMGLKEAKETVEAAVDLCREIGPAAAPPRPAAAGDAGLRKFADAAS